MAEDEERERQTTEPEAEITSEENPIEEHELELSLGLRPIHPRPRIIISSTLPEISNSSPNPNPSSNSNPPIAFSKRDVQALRRQEAKMKRDLKRKANNYRGVDRDRDRDRNSGELTALDGAGSCCKLPKLNPSYWAPSSCWTWNPASAGGVGFRPYQGQNGKLTPGGQNIDGENRQSISSGSSSGISDNYQSTSGPGGTSSDVGSHSSYPPSQASPPTIPSTTSQVQPCSSQVDLQSNGSTPNHSQAKLCNSSSNQMETIMSSRQPSKSSEGRSTSSTALTHSQTLVQDGSSSDKGCSPTAQSQSPKEVKAEIGKPPKPTGPTNQQKLLLAQMPCVSVTGNGPNGKTITGFLYQYTKAEVSIVCVCHGASFSPAGFVEHAGGVDVKHPLRHIRVVPFALG